MNKRKPKNIHPEIGLTLNQRTIRRYARHDLVEREWHDGDGGTVTVREWHTKTGYIIDQKGARHKGRTGLLKFILKHEIEAEPIRPEDRYCSIGRAPDGTWYGWTHRGMCGFKPLRDYAFDARKLKDDTPFQQSTDRLILTSRGARGSAIRFSKYIS